MCGWKDRLCCSFWTSSSMNADWNVFNTCFTSRVSVELEQRMFCRRPYQWMTAFTSEAWWWSTSDSSTWAATKRAFHAPLTLAMWNSLNLVLGDMVVFHIVISPACEIADTRYYRARWMWERERLSVLVIGYFITIWGFWVISRLGERERAWKYQKPK